MRKKVQRVLLVLLALVVLVLLAGVRFDKDPAELEARYATAPSKFLDVDGARVHYRDSGSGPPIVLVHGSNASLFTWEGWTERLASSHRVIALDMPGHGLTGPDPKARYSAAEMAELVAAFTTKLGIERFAIAGNSMGGNVAWHLAVLHPERIEKLILVDSAGLPREEPKPFAFRIASTPGLNLLARWDTPRFIVSKSLHDLYGDPTKVTDVLVDRYYDLLLREGNRAATRERFAKGDDDLHTRLGELKVPTLILWGARDPWILPKYGDRFHAMIPGSTLVVLDGLGHTPMEEDPDASLAPVKGFL